MTFAAVALSGAASTYSFADEGLERITNIGDHDLVAQNKIKPKPKQQTYKSVNEEPPASDAFKGSPFAQTNNIFLGLGLDYFDSFGFQGRYAARLVDKGFIPDINNSFYVEGGIGLTFYGDRRGQTATGFDFVVTGRWDFQFDPTWTFFGDLGLGYNAVSNDRKDDVKGGGVFPAIGAGAMYTFDPEWSARFDLSFQFLGVGILHRF